VIITSLVLIISTKAIALSQARLKNRRISATRTV